jgi:hypothetical protein
VLLPLVLLLLVVILTEQEPGTAEVKLLSYAQ